MLIPLLYDRGRERHGAILRELSAMVESGKVKPLCDARRFNFTDVAAAHAWLQGGRAVGKIVLSGF